MVEVLQETRDAGFTMPANNRRRDLVADGGSVLVTLGDRAEDVFLVSGPALQNSRTVLQLEQDLLQELSLPPQPGARPRLIPG